MAENEDLLYKQYYDYFTRDIATVKGSSKLKNRIYVGPTSKKADNLVAKSMPADEQSRAIIKKAAEDALKKAGLVMDSKGMNMPDGSVRAWNATQSWAGNTAAKAAIEKINKDAKVQQSMQTELPNFNGIKQDAIMLAQQILGAMQSGQDISAYISMIPEDADKLFKAAFIYTIATGYKPKSPEVAKEMAALAQRHQLDCERYKLSKKDKLSWQEQAIVNGGTK